MKTIPAIRQISLPAIMSNLNRSEFHGI